MGKDHPADLPDTPLERLFDHLERPPVFDVRNVYLPLATNKELSVSNAAAQANKVSVPPRAHNHYFKSVKGLTVVDVYRVLCLFNVTDPCLSHAVKKLLVAGGRGAGKDIHKDVQEAIDTLTRWQEMQKENAGL